MKSKVLACLLVLSLGISIIMPASTVSADTTKEERTYEVKKGDCLYAIGKKLGVKWRDIAKANQIESPWIIRPNQILVIPSENQKIETTKKAKTIVGQYSGKQIPAVGESLAGFKVTKIGSMAQMGADTISLEHIKTGARVLFVLNDDIDRGFSIGFHTEPVDDTGLNHILEHTAVMSSEKYPDNSLLMNVGSQTYNTGTNALTTNNSTSFLVASANEDQLYKLTDMCVNATFHPEVRVNPNFFYREGWRYELNDKDAPLTINGVVYNEMKANYSSIGYFTHIQAMKALFPDTYQSKSSGGDPDCIPNLKYEDFVAYYDENYHPSNSVSYFYGDLELERFLTLLNTEFNTHTRKDGLVYSPVQTPFKEQISVTADFPVSVDSTTGAELCYVFALDSSYVNQAENYFSVSLLCSLLNEAGGVLMQNLNASGIANGYSVGMNLQGQQQFVMFSATDADSTRAEEFKQIVVSSLSYLVESGINQDIIDTIFASQAFSYLLARDGSSTAFNSVTNVIYSLMTGNDDLIDSYSALQAIEKKQTAGYYEAILKSCFIDNTHAALVSVVPKKGLLEERQNAEIERLQAIKSSMSEKEIADLVKKTADFTAWAAQPANAETMAKMQAVDFMKLEAEPVSFEYLPKEIDDCSTYAAVIAPDEIAFTSLAFDLSHLTMEELCYLNLYLTICGSSTETMSATDVIVTLGQMAQGASLNISFDDETGVLTPYLITSSFARSENLEKVLALIKTIATETDVDANLQLLYQNMYYYLQAYTDAETVFNDVAFEYASGYSDSSSAIISTFGFSAFVSTMTAAISEIQADPVAFAAKIEAIRDKTIRKENMIAYYVGGNNALDSFYESIETLYQDMDANTGESQVYSADPVLETTAFTVSTTSGYVVYSATDEALDYTRTGAMRLLQDIINNEYLYPEIRVKGGAYGSYIGIGSTEISLYSYRDGKYMNTISVFEGLPEFVENLTLSEEALNAYKLSALSAYLMPTGIYASTMERLGEMSEGKTDSETERIVKEIQAATIEDLRALSGLMKTFLEKSGKVVIASPEAINENADIFDGALQF